MQTNPDALVSHCTERLLVWLAAQNFRGYDPSDALTGPFLGAIGRRNRYFGIVVTQALRCVRLNFRPLLGADVIDWLGCPEWEAALGRGYCYWQTHFFREDGAPKYYPHSLYPIDAHSIAAAVLLWLRMEARRGCRLFCHA